MSDDSPWRPPAPGEPETAWEPTLPSPSPEPDVDSPPVSPWAREGDATSPEQSDVPVLPTAVPPSDGFAPPAPNLPVRPPSPADAEPISAPPAEPDAATPTGRSTKAVAIAAAVIVAVGLAGIFAVRGLTGETAGGSSTPDELGEELLDAIEGEDMLGVIDLMLPGERETLGEPIIDTVSELQRLEVLASDLDLARIAGLDITLDGRSVVVESTNVADIVHVGLGADAVVTVDGAEIPIGDLITDNVPEDALTELRGSRTTENETFDLELVAVEEDGRWYFSAWYTVAELGRETLGMPSIPVEGVGAVGADTPEEALAGVIDDLETLDVRGLIQSLDPYEASALQRYAPLFLADAEAAVAGFGDGVRVLEYGADFDGSGSSRTAFIDSFTVEFSEDGVGATVSYHDGCFRGEWSGDGVDESMEFCGNDVDLAEEMAGVSVPPEVEALAQIVSDAFADLEPTGIELRERDGQWYVSPISTVGEAWLGALRALDRDELDAIIEAIPPAFEAMMGDLVTTDEWLDSPVTIEDEWLDSPDTTAGDDGWLDSRDATIEDDWLDSPDATIEDDWLDGGSVDVDADAGDDDGGTVVPADDPVTACYATVDTAEATTCFDDLVAAGEVDVWAVPAVLRHPECGLAEIMWSNDIYTATDDEFATAIRTAAPCFADLVTDGTIEEWEVPFEVTEFDCFEGRNWYASFDDPDYDERVRACIGSD